MSRRKNVYNNGTPRTGIQAGRKSAARKTSKHNYHAMTQAFGRNK